MSQAVSLPDGALGEPPSTAPRLPADCVLLPLGSGGLLVSRSHALYCRIPAADLPWLAERLQGPVTLTELPEPLGAELARHGFGGPPRAPSPPSPSVQLQLTNACNLDCTYCCTNSGQARAHEVNRDRLLEVLSDVRAVLGPRTRIALLGGEPLLVPWALELAEHAQRLELHVTLFTNGLLLAEEPTAARAAALIGRGGEIRVSLAGPRPQLCDRVSGAPRFERVLAGLHAVARHGQLPIIDLMLFPQHVDEVASHLPELRKLLPGGIKIALGICYLSGREQGEHLFGSRAELERSLDRIAFEGGETIAATEHSPVTERREGCTCALGHHLHVRSDGALFTCFKMEEQVGDLGKQSFAEALRALRQSARPAATLPRCADCALATLCGGGCRSENLQLTGDADEPVCGPWRVRVLSELLAEDYPSALEWPAAHLLAEAKARGIDAPDALPVVRPSKHLADT